MTNAPDTPTLNDTFLKALRREATEYTPVWLMRQAGRYLPEYMATRSKAGSFMGLATNPDFATEVTLQPIERYGLDAAILFSDILTVPDAMGLGLEFVAGEGPQFAHPLRQEKEIMALQVPDMAKLQYVFDAVKQIRQALTTLKQPVPLIGFSGSPWTLACYMVEGKSSKDYQTIKTMLYQRPDLLNHILEINALAVTDYLNAQIRAGAQAVMIFDSWGGVLSDDAYLKFSLAYIKNVTSGLLREFERQKIPVITFTKGSGSWLHDLAQCGTDAVGLDWTVNLQMARALIGKKVALQGNMDPAVLLSHEKAIRQEVHRILLSFGSMHGDGAGHIFNLGHGIGQHTPVESVAILVDEVHRYSRQFHYPD